MKIPVTPPPMSELFAKTTPERLVEIFSRAQFLDSTKYYHWNDLRYRKPPEGFSTEEWWIRLRLSRSQSSRELPLTDAEERPFWYTLPDRVFDLLHQIDSEARGYIAIDEAITSPESRDRYLVTSLIEEAITSSQLEGASTTRKEAVAMLRTGRKPRDRSERMIVNNYLAMRHVRELVGEQLVPGLVLELHRILTRDALDNPEAAGRLQRPGERRVHVVDHRDNAVLHVPPPAELLPQRLEAMCAFANGALPDGTFVHPIVRAITLHFWLAYDHPFEDGNGRTARALFYWSMLASGYWLSEYISISKLLSAAPSKYARAFLHTETDGNDLTYFLLHQLEIIKRSIDELYSYLERKVKETRELERALRDAAHFNYRQRALLAHALRHPDARYTIESHRRSHNVAYATARSDLLDLVNKELLVGKKLGRSMSFFVPPDLEHKL